MAKNKKDLPNLTQAEVKDLEDRFKNSVRMNPDKLAGIVKEQNKVILKLVEHVQYLQGGNK